MDSNSYTQGVREYMNWLPIRDLSGYRIYPTFFEDRLNDIPDHSENIVTWEYDKEL